MLAMPSDFRSGKSLKTGTYVIGKISHLPLNRPESTAGAFGEGLSKGSTTQHAGTKAPWDGCWMAIHLGAFPQDLGKFAQQSYSPMQLSTQTSTDFSACLLLLSISGR